MAYQREFTAADARELLYKKLFGIIMSTFNGVCAGLLVVRACVCVSHERASGAVEKRFAWNKQILHVWCEKASNAKVIEEEFYRMPSELCADTVVLLTVAENSDYIFSSKFYPLPMGVRPIVVDRRRGRP